MTDDPTKTSRRTVVKAVAATAVLSPLAGTSAAHAADDPPAFRHGIASGDRCPTASSCGPG